MQVNLVMANDSCWLPAVLLGSGLAHQWRFRLRLLLQPVYCVRLGRYGEMIVKVRPL